jgi:hypothetical protein
LYETSFEVVSYVKTFVELVLSLRIGAIYKAPLLDGGNEVPVALSIILLLYVFDAVPPAR